MAARLRLRSKSVLKFFEIFSREFLDFMDYIMMSTDKAVEKTESNRIRLIHEKVRKIRISEKMGVKYMQRWEEVENARDDGREEESLELVRKICNVAKENAPGFNCDEIYSRVYGEKYSV